MLPAALGVKSDTAGDAKKACGEATGNGFSVTG